MPDDRTIRIDGSLEGMASIAKATPSREAILEAAEAFERGADVERGEVHPRHMLTLYTALICRRSPYVVEVEKELAAYRGPKEDFTEHLLRHRAGLKPLFRSELEAVIKEAREAS
jgi:hypothetical protein